MEAEEILREAALSDAADPASFKLGTVGPSQ
jgi:hypothetical protein